MVKLRSFQTALFSNMITLDDKIAYASKLLESSGGVFDGDPAILPIPNDGPLEVPRIIVKSSDGKYVCNTSLKRVDLFFYPKEDNELSAVRNEYLALLKKIVVLLNETYRIKMDRVGLVANLVLELSESSNTFISRKYLKEHSLISDTRQIQLHSLNRIQLLDRYEANRWLRIMTSGKDPNVPNESSMTVTIDINTSPDMNYDFDVEVVGMIFNDAIKNMSELLAAHYPEV